MQTVPGTFRDPETLVFACKERRLSPQPYSTDRFRVRSSRSDSQKSDVVTGRERPKTDIRSAFTLQYGGALTGFAANDND